MTFVRGVGGHSQDRSQAAVNLPHQTSTREVRIANFSRWGPLDDERGGPTAEPRRCNF